MSARLPKCAWCGAPLARQAYITVKIAALPGKPTVGWHWAESGLCASNDHERAAFEAGNDGDRLLEAIEKRGPGRVARVGWTTTDARCLKLGRNDGKPRKRGRGAK